MNEGRSRRSFLKLLPLGVLAGVVASIGGAAFRFLRPRIGAVSDAWLDVAMLSQLKGPQPLARKILAEAEAAVAGNETACFMRTDCSVVEMSEAAEQLRKALAEAQPFEIPTTESPAP